MASSSSSYQEPAAESELEDPFHRLPDDLLLLIINKLFQAKALIQLSLVSKRFFSLVFQTHFVFVELDLSHCGDGNGPSFVRRLFGFLRNLVTRTWTTPTIPDSNTQKQLSDILRPFQQIKHLHVHLRCLDSADPKPLESGAFIRWVAAFGSHFEFLQLLSALSVNPCVAAAGAGAGDDVVVTHGLNNEFRQGVLGLIVPSLKIASNGYDMIREHVLGLAKLESVVVSNDYGQVVMGKEQIARLRSSTNTNQGQGVLDSDVVGLGCYVPTLDLLESGYNMKDVVFVHVIGVNKDDSDENVTVAEFYTDDDNMEVAILDDSEFKHWQVFDDAVRVLLMNEETPMEVMFRG